MSLFQIKLALTQSPEKFAFQSSAKTPDSSQESKFKTSLNYIIGELLGLKRA